MRLFTLCIALACVTVTAASASDWKFFRGSSQNGTTPDRGFPLTWGPEENIRWKVPLPASGNSSPVVVGQRVFVTCATEEGRYRGLYCYDRKTGEKLWEQVVEYDGKEPTHRTNPYCGSSPGSDGRRVVVWEGSAGVHCYDLDGNKLWSRDLGTFRHIWGYGSSPVFYKNSVILNCGPGNRQFITALDADTGNTIWEVEIPEGADAEYPAATGNRDKWIGSWATPIVRNIQGRDEVIVSLPHEVRSFDPATGATLWTCSGLGTLAYTDTLIDAERGIGVAMGGFRGPAIAFRLGGSGDITETHRLWRVEDGNPQRIGSGIILGDHIFMANEPGIAECIELATGKSLWRERLPGGGLWGSIVHADGRLYVTNQKGTTIVFAPSTTGLEVLAENHLEEPSNSTPALSDGEIFLRTFDHLFCIAKDDQEQQK